MRLYVQHNEAAKKSSDSQNPSNFEGTCTLCLREIVAYTLFCRVDFLGNPSGNR